MPRIQIDFGDVNVFDTIPEGVHPAVVDKLDIRQKDENSYPYLNWDFLISDGPAKGRHAFLRTSLSEKALWRLVPVLQAVGIAPKEPEALKQFNFEFDYDEETLIITQPQVVGIPVLLTITHERAGSSVYSNVSDVSAPTRLASPAPTSETPSAGLKINMPQSASAETPPAPPVSGKPKLTLK